MKSICRAVSALIAALILIPYLCACSGGPETTAADTTEPQSGTAAETEAETQTEPETTTEEKEVRTFYNPISDRSMPDPFITYHDGYFYGLATEVTYIRLYRSRTAEDLFLSGEYKDLIKTGDDLGNGKTLGWNVWAPELHYVPTYDRWYVYSCACTDGFDFNTMRMFCLESEGGDPFGDYTFKGFTIKDKICIDQTVYYDEDSGSLYTAYCDFTADKGQVVMIAEMSEPWKVGLKRVMITYPHYSWERRGTDENNDGRVNEGPVFLKHDGKIYLIYSASGCWSEWYSLGVLEYVGENTEKRNFLDPDNWVKSKKAIFSKANEVYGVGHCSFFTSPDGTETWMAYHGMAAPDAGVEGRYAYIQKIGFNENGSPDLGEPLSRETAIPVPSGE
ncbi:MAG: glycoside hydrolase family 43 protein [Clostridia bacterium]|nr:glycoside hydrolase family 43 protein [Clostridia bacterium]